MEPETKQYQSVEEYADHIRKVTSRTLGAMFNRMGPEHPAALAIEQLCTEAANIVNQAQMQQEQSGSYDLTALAVNVSVPSDSETGYEDRD